MTRPIDTVDETLECVCLRLKTDDEVDRSLERGIGDLERENLSKWKCSSVKSLQLWQEYVTVFKENHAIEPITERMPWPLRKFYVNKFYSDRYFCLRDYDLTLL